MDILRDAGWRERQRAAWESAPVHLRRLSGPPNWMVLEEWKGEKVEAFVEAAGRLRGKMGLGPVASSVAPPVSVAKPVAGAESVAVSVACEGCGKEVKGYGKVCSTCRSKAYRGRHDAG